MIQLRNFGNHRSLGTKNLTHKAPWAFHGSATFKSMFGWSFFPHPLQNSLSNISGFNGRKNTDENCSCVHYFLPDFSINHSLQLPSNLKIVSLHDLQMAQMIQVLEMYYGCWAHKDPIPRFSSNFETISGVTQVVQNCREKNFHRLEISFNF